MFLDIDIGNTRAKWRLSGSGNSEVEACASSFGHLKALLGQQASFIQSVRIAAVKNEEFCRELEQYIVGELSLSICFAKTQEQTGNIVNGYSDPSKMGVDRWAAIVAASNYHHKSKIHNKLYAVVDAGSALTLDFVAVQEAKEQHLGGYIVPGVNLQISSLLGGTQRIGVDSETPGSSIELGNNTHDAVCAGVVASMVALVNETAKRVEKAQGAEAIIYLTGGDGSLLKPSLQRPVVLRPNLVLDGIPLLVT